MEEEERRGERWKEGEGGKDKGSLSSDEELTRSEDALSSGEELDIEKDEVLISANEQRNISPDLASAGDDIDAATSSRSCEDIVTAASSAHDKSGHSESYGVCGPDEEGEGQEGVAGLRATSEQDSESDEESLLMHNR